MPKVKKTTIAKSTIAKSAVTGKVVSKKFAKDNPDTTFTQKRPAKAIVPDYLPLVGKYVMLDDQLAVIESLDPLRVMLHAVENGVHTNNVLEIESLDKHKITEVSTDEAFGILTAA